MNIPLYINYLVSKNSEKFCIYNVFSKETVLIQFIVEHFSASAIGLVFSFIKGIDYSLFCSPTVFFLFNNPIL